MSIDMSKFHVVTMISNPVRYDSRYRLYIDFKHRLKRAGIKLWTAEIAFGTRPFAITQAHDNADLQLRTEHELWHKERALNLLINRLTETHPDWEYVAWIDADLEFPRWEGPKAWHLETVHMLQHYHVVQLFQNAIDLGPCGEALHTHNGFAYSYKEGLPFKQGYANWHPGFAWAMTRHAYDSAPIIDYGALGSGDRHMACGLIGQIQKSINGGCTPEYKQKLALWQEQADRGIRRDIGYVPGTVLHHFHGPKVARGYQDRWKILVDTKFNPDRDLKADAYGLWQLADHGDLRSIEMRDKFRAYFFSRREDSMEIT